MKNNVKNIIETTKFKVKTVDKIDAPVKKGDKIGEATFFVDGEKLTVRDVVAKKDVPKITLFKMFGKNLVKWVTLQ